jgi:hypothetical protein
MDQALVNHPSIHRWHSGQPRVGAVSEMFYSTFSRTALTQKKSPDNPMDTWALSGTSEHRSWGPFKNLGWQCSHIRWGVRLLPPFWAPVEKYSPKLSQLELIHAHLITLSQPSYCKVRTQPLVNAHCTSVCLSGKIPGSFLSLLQRFWATTPNSDHHE